MEGVVVNPVFWRGRKVFVTGHTGFKGSWLCLWLADAGADVVGYADGIPTQPSLYETAEVETAIVSITGDVRDRDRLRQSLERHRPEVVFHLAAQSLVRPSFADPLGTYETNVLGTANMLEAARSVPEARVVVNVTTDKVYAEKGEAAHTEDGPLGGADPYSSSKACSELVTAAFRASFFDGEGNAAIATARAGNVIGGGDWARDRLVPDVMAAVTAGRPVEIRYPEAVRPWQHVLNALDGYLLLAERLWDGRVVAGPWNFGPDEEDRRAVEWVVRQLADRWGAGLEIVRPEVPQLPEAAELHLDSTRARQQLGWRPGWGLERALDSIVEWYQVYASGGSVRDITLAQIHAHRRERDPLPLPT